MTADGRGYLTLAVGEPRYLEMAVDMALSLRKHTDLPVALAADPPLADLARGRYAPVFDHVSVIAERFLDRRAIKYGTAEASPFEETIFVDADCFVLSSPDALMGALESSDMAMVGELLDATLPDENHHGFRTRKLIRRFGLSRYLKSNSGVFCFRRGPARQIMDECLRCYLHEARPKLWWGRLRGKFVGDEIAFGIVGGRRGLATLPEPGPMYWPHEFASIDLDAPSKPILHLIWPPPEAVLARLLDQAVQLRAAAGVSGNAEEHWRDEVRKMERWAERKGPVTP